MIFLPKLGYRNCTESSAFVHEIMTLGMIVECLTLVIKVLSYRRGVGYRTETWREVVCLSTKLTNLSSRLFGRAEIVVV